MEGRIHWGGEGGGWGGRKCFGDLLGTGGGGSKIKKNPWSRGVIYFLGILRGQNSVFITTNVSASWGGGGVGCCAPRPPLHFQLCFSLLSRA